MIAEVVATGSLIVRQVTFDAGSEAPAASSDGALEQLRAVLAEHDEWTFEVQVHTDDGGTARAGRGTVDGACEGGRVVADATGYRRVPAGAAWVRQHAPAARAARR